MTDANLVLGRLVETEFLGGTFALDTARARTAMAGLARALGRSVEAAASGMVAVVAAAMERALRVITVERGLDPRGLALVAFGGAGGLHAAELARSLGMRRVYLPPQPGLLSAWGMLAAGVLRDFGRTVRLVDPSDDVVRAHVRTLADEARRALRRDGVRSPQLEPLVEVRYAGQSYELAVPWTRDWRTHFHRLHREQFGHAHPERALEVVTARVRARAPGARLPADVLPRRRRVAPVAVRRAVFEGRGVRTRVYRRDELPVGWRGRGPAIVCEYSATTVVPPGWSMRVEPQGGVLLEDRDG